MIRLSDVVRQLEEKASLYDDLVSDLQALLNKYKVKNGLKEVAEEDSKLWMVAYRNSKKVFLEHGDSWVEKRQLLRNYGQLTNYNSRGSWYRKYIQSGEALFNETRVGVMKFVRPKKYIEEEREGEVFYAQDLITKDSAKSNNSPKKLYYNYSYTCGKYNRWSSKRKGIPCGRKCIHTTKKEITKDSNHQSMCKHCKVRMRLNPSNTQLISTVWK